MTADDYADWLFRDRRNDQFLVPAVSQEPTHPTEPQRGVEPK